MFREVILFHGNRKAILGKDAICSIAEPNGWGTGCAILARMPGTDRHVCDDCGTVYDQLPPLPVLARSTTVDCTHTTLVQVMGSRFDKFFGYECPFSLYVCLGCGQVYKCPPMAESGLQQSEPARDFVLSREAAKAAEVEQTAQAAAKLLSRLPSDARARAIAAAG